MDADLLLPQEGDALLQEIEGWCPPTDSDDAQRTHAERFIQALEAIMRTDRLDTSARQAVLETAHALLHQLTDPTAPGSQSCKPRD
jgi:hypothetical protein